MTMRIWNVALGLVLAAGIGAAHAQTTIAQPADTTVKQIGKRPMSLAPAKQMTLRKVARADATTIRRGTTVTRTAPVQRSATVTRTTTRRVVKTAERPPLDLTPVQRATVYRTIAQELIMPAPVVTTPVAPPMVVTTPAPTFVAPPARTIVTTPAPIVAAPVAPMAPAVTEQVVTAPAPTQQIVTVPSTTGFGTAGAPGVATVTYRVGAPLPAGIPVYAMPSDVIATAPALRTYGYATVGDRVLVIDPATNVVVDELIE